MNPSGHGHGVGSDVLAGTGCSGLIQPTVAKDRPVTLLSAGSTFGFAAKLVPSSQGHWRCRVNVIAARLLHWAPAEKGTEVVGALEESRWCSGRGPEREEMRFECFGDRDVS
jgi:hypothetical protein